MTQINGVRRHEYPMMRDTAPQYNAVKIDIHNPQVNTQPQYEKKENYCTCPIYEYPQNQIYETPKASIYEPKANTKQVQMQVPPPVVIQQSVQKNEKEPESVLKNQNVTNPVEAEKKASVDKAETTPKNEAVAPKNVDVKKPEDVKPAIDINAFIKELANADYEKQAVAMEALVQLVQVAPNVAVDLLDVKVVDTLLNLINQNTSNLAGPSPRQIEIRERIIKGEAINEAELAEANKTTPMELAERNKQYAIFTVATLDKLYGSEVKKITGEQPPLTELPGTADIVEQIAKNPNPMVRIAGIKALNYIKEPEYKQDLKAIYTIAANDPDPIVKKTAQTATERLEK